MHVLGLCCCRCVRAPVCVYLLRIYFIWANTRVVSIQNCACYNVNCATKAMLVDVNARLLPRHALFWSLPADFRNNETPGTNTMTIPNWCCCCCYLHTMTFLQLRCKHQNRPSHYKNINLHLRIFIINIIIIIIITTDAAMLLIITITVLHLNKVAHFQLLYSNAFLLQVRFLSHHHFARGNSILGK